ncbi:MAG: TniQ family protein, partial [Devosia sp.]|nr:TniQ family protein [Devosia sp.]
LGQLADITGASAEELVRWSPKRINEKYMSLNGELLHTRDNPRYEIRLCPVCAQQDIAGNPAQPWDQTVYGRAEWMLAVVDCCLEHQVRLISRRGPQLDAVRIDAGYEATMLLEELHALELEQSAPDDFQLYILSRIGVIQARRSPLLDNVPLVAVTQLCHAAGLDILAGKGNGAGLSDVERRKAGFAMLGHGTAVLEGKITAMRQGSKLRVGAVTLLRRLMEYLHQGRYTDPAFAPFLDEFVPVLFRTLPYAEGQTILGRRCQKRSLHDFTSAQAAYGVPAHQLAAFLDGTPNLAVQPFGQYEDALIDVEVANALFIGHTPFLKMSEVARKLGRTDQLARKDLAALHASGLLREARGAAVSPRNAFYSEPEIDSLIQRLARDAEELDTEDPTMVSIYDLAFKFGMTNQNFWDLVADGRLVRMRRVRGTGFIDGLRVDLGEVMQVLCGLKRAFTRPEVCKLLEVDSNIVRILEANGVLRSVPVDPRYSNKLGHMFDADEVQAFRKQYMTLPEVRQFFPERPSFQRLEKMGLSPAIHLKPISKAPGYAIFFSRADVLSIR